MTIHDCSPSSPAREKVALRLVIHFLSPSYLPPPPFEFLVSLSRLSSLLHAWRRLVHHLSLLLLEALPDALAAGHELADATLHAARLTGHQ